MEYKIIVKKAFTAFRSDFERPAEQLAAEVNEHIERGWEPQGGVGCGQSRVAKVPYLFQAMVKRRG